MQKKITDFFKQGIEPLLSILFAFLASSILILIIKQDPLKVYGVMISGDFSNLANFGEVLIKTTTLILTGLSFGIAYKCGLCTIGAEGQLYIGGCCSIFVGLYLQNLPPVLNIILALIAGAVGGGLWGLLVGWLKVQFHSNEVITTIMLNYIAMLFSNYLAAGPMKEAGSNSPQSAQIPQSEWLYVFVKSTRLHIGIFLALIALFLYWYLLNKTKTGFEIRVVGQNQDAAKYAGINVKKNILLTMFISGACGGLAGCMEIVGIQHRLIQNFSSGYGMTGIAVSLLGNNSPVGILFSGFLFGALKNGGNNIKLFTAVPAAIIDVIQASVIFFVLLNIVGKMKEDRRKKHHYVERV